ncbi:hypothetical protein [Massilia sp.]|uniref:hypothetical protein n=1 Tax=Massilia sp. TaxID=1882437 RepID=UPI0028A7C32F|nr:hypothetical protein [Massilia sp.]
MTLIASYVIDGFPLVFGDLLITGEVSSHERPVAVPAQGEVQAFFGNFGWGISGLTQKVNIVSENCVIAWAGSWLGARIAISGLRDLAKQKDLTASSIISFLAADPDLKNHSAHFVGLVSQEEGLCMFQYGAEAFQSESLGTVYVAGSGAEAIREFSTIFSGMATNARGAVTNAAMGISKSLMMGGLLLQAELHGGYSAPTLRNMFGGGYEIAYYADGRMQKVPEVTFLFWDVRLTRNDSDIFLPFLVVKQAYIGDYLLMRSIRFGESHDKLTPNVLDEQRHVVAPIFASENRPTEVQLRSLAFASRLLCHCVIVHDDIKTLGIHTKVQGYDPQAEGEVVFIEEQDGLRFKVHQNLLDKLLKNSERFRP